MDDLRDISILRETFAKPGAEELFKSVLPSPTARMQLRFTIPALRIPTTKHDHMVETLTHNLETNSGEYGWEASITGPEYTTFYDFAIRGNINDLVGVIDGLTGYAKF